MIHIKPVSIVRQSIEEYAQLSEHNEIKLDEADHQASTTDKRLFHDEVFNSVRASLDETKQL